MKNVLKIIGMLAIIASLGNIVVLSIEYNANIIRIGAFGFICLLGFVLIIFAENMKKRVSEEDIEAYFINLRRKELRDQMAQWDEELNEEEIEKLSRGKY